MNTNTNKNNEQKSKTIMYCRYTEVHDGNYDCNYCGENYECLSSECCYASCCLPIGKFEPFPVNNSDHNPLLPSPDGDFGDAVWDYTDVDVKVMYNSYLDKLRAEGERRFGGTWK